MDMLQQVEEDSRSGGWNGAGRWTTHCFDLFELVEHHGPDEREFFTHFGCEDNTCQLSNQQMCAGILADRFDPSVHTNVRLVNDCGRFLLLFLKCLHAKHGLDTLRHLRVQLIDRDRDRARQMLMFDCPMIHFKTEENIENWSAEMPSHVLLFVNFDVNVFSTSFENFCGYLCTHPTSCLLSCSGHWAVQDLDSVAKRLTDLSRDDGTWTEACYETCERDDGAVFVITHFKLRVGADGPLVIPAG